MFEWKSINSWIDIRLFKVEKRIKASAITGTKVPVHTASNPASYLVGCIGCVTVNSPLPRVQVLDEKRLILFKASRKHGHEQISEGKRLECRYRSAIC
jgi:hypothetical protein